MTSLHAYSLPAPASAGALALLPHPYPGALVTFCGIDGSGKTSLIEAARAHLESLGRTCVSTFTPTARIRKNPLFRELVDASTEEARSRVDVMGLCLQILGDLLQHQKDTLIPHLERGDVVLCDRYIFTSQAEIRARGGDADVEALLASVAERVLKPDVAFALDAPPELAEWRVRQRESERDKPLDSRFVETQAAAYLSVARQNGLSIISTARPLSESLLAVRQTLNQQFSGSRV
jgi:dTMP kinase